MGSPLGIKIKFKVDDVDIKKYIETLQKDGINIDIKNFSQIDKQFKDIISNVKQLKSLKELKIINNDQLKNLKEVSNLLKEISALNKNIKVDFSNQQSSLLDLKESNKELEKQNSLLNQQKKIINEKNSKIGTSSGQNVEKVTEKFTFDENGNKNFSQKMKEWTDEAGKTFKLTQKINSETGELENKVETVVKNYKKQAEEREKALQEEQKIRAKLDKLNEKEFEKEYKNVYSQAEKSINNQIEIQKKLIKAKELETETLINNLKLEEENYNNLKMQLDIADKIKLDKNKDNLQRTKVDPLISRELDKQLEEEKKLIEKTEKAIAESKRKQREEELKETEKQANKTNKLMDQNWSKIESFKKSQNNSLNNMGYKYQGLYQTNEIEKFREELSKLSPTSETLEQDIDKLSNKIKDFKNELITRNNMYKLGVDISDKNNGVNINSSEDEIKNLIKNIGGVNAEIKKIDNTPILQNGNEIKKVNYRVKEGKDKWHEYQLSIVQAVNGGNVSLRQLDRGMRDVINRQVSFSARLRHAWNSVLSFAGVSGLFFGIKRSIQNGIRNIIDLDTAMTDLKKVTDESDESYKKFVNTANQMAIAVGHSTKAAIDATTEFAKLGFTMKESAKLAQESLIYSNIGDINIDSATKSIISTLKGFNMTANDTRHIIDAVNEVGNNFAVTTGGIGESLQRSASSLNEANNTFEQSIGLITAANASVQDPEKVGNSLEFRGLVA